MSNNLRSTSALAKRSELHLMRRFWHVACGVVCLCLYHFSEINISYWGVVSILIAILGFALDFKRLQSPDLNRKLTELFGPIMRRSEKMSFSGLPFYALGVGISIFLYEEKIAILAILFLVFADPAASICGVYYGKDRLLPNKTLQGTIAAFSTALLVCVIYLLTIGVNSANIILFSFFAALVAALSEMLSAFNIDDNLTIPVVSGVGLTVLNHWLKVI